MASEEWNALWGELSEAERARVIEFGREVIARRADKAESWTFDFCERFGEAKVSAEKDRAGMEVLVGAATCGGVTRLALWEHPPLSGAAVVGYAVPVPPHLRGLKLTFTTGIRDGAELPSDRFVAFRVVVNGWKLWSAVQNARAWEPVTVMMPELARDVALIEFQTDGMGDHRWNWAVWGEPRLVAERGSEGVRE